MLKVSPHDCWFRAISMNWSRVIFSSANKCEKYLSIIHSGNSSLPGRDRGMRGEDIGLAHLDGSFFKGHCRSPYTRACAAASGKRNGLRSCARQSAYNPACAGPARRPSQQHFLRDAHFLVAGIQARGQLAVGRVVAFQVGVQQIQRDAPNLNLQDARANFPPGQGDRYGQWSAVFICQWHHRQFFIFKRQVAGFLPAILGDFLGEIALGVIKANRPPAAGPDRRLPSGDRLRECPGRRHIPAAIHAGQTQTKNKRSCCFGQDLG